jgi:hypothetical protein
MGNSSGGSGLFAHRGCAAPREDGARLAKPRNLCIDGVQDVVVQVRSFRSIARITGWAGRRLPDGSIKPGGGLFTLYL